MSSATRHRGALAAFAFLLLCLSPRLATAQPIAVKAPTPLRWWEVAGGILGVPATIVGIAYSYVLIRKTNLEVRKTALENQKLELELAKSAGSPGKAPRPQNADAISILARPAAESRLANLILVRFVVFSLVLSFYGVLRGLIGLLGSGLLLVLFGASGGAGLDGPAGGPVVIVATLVLNGLPKLVESLIVLAIGIPLFRDANRLFGIDLSLPGLRRWWRGRD